MADDNSNLSNNKVEEGTGVNAVQYEDGNHGSLDSGNGIPAPPRSKKAILLQHLKRFWWLYFIIFLLIVVLSVMLVVFVGVKNIAQSKINGAVLEVQGISCTDTKPDTFRLGINTTLKSGTTKATVRAFEGVMYLEDEPSHKPFATITFPETHNQRFQTVNISQEVKIPDVGALTTFNAWLLNNDSVRVTVLGHPRVKVPGIQKTYGVTFKKTVTIPGLSGFKGMSVHNSSISIGGFSDGSNFHSTVVIPNRSVMTFEIGNATFANFLNGSLVGSSIIDNILLSPGNNTYPIRSTIDQGPILNAVQSQPYCESGIVPFDMNGRTVLNFGQPLPYFADALATRNTTVDIDLDTPLKALGLNPKCSSS